MVDSVSVVSYAPGRIRFHLEFKGDEILADTLRRELQRIESVRLETYSVRTRNALVTYDASRTTDVAVATALLRGVREFARLHGECDLERHEHEHQHDHGHSGDEHDEDCEHDHSATATDAGIRKELFKLAVTGAVLGWFVYKKLNGKPIRIDGNPLANVASLVTIASGYRIFRAGVDSVSKHGKATDDTLISIAVIATILMGESITGLSVVWLINLGRLLEAITLKRSRTAIKELMDISPTEAWLVDGGNVNRTPVEKIEKGQRIRIFHTEKVPLDGQIVSGTALVKEAFITGEAIPREKGPGDTVYAGSLIESGDIDIEVTNLVHDTVVARMIDAIENVRDRKAPIEKIGTRFASKFIPISLGISAVTLVLTGDLRRAITMLVIACPCAAGLATPTAVSASIGQAARRGILIKGGTHIEAAARIDTVIFDKTGTLTLGAPILHHFVDHGLADTIGFDEALRLSGSAEQHTTHPLGLALVAEARKRGMTLSPVDHQKSHAGLGVHARVEGRNIHIGNRRFLKTVGTEVPPNFDSETLREFVAGESVVYLSIDGRLRGAFIVQDKIRPEARAMLARLKALGVIRIALASGDQRYAADRVARELGIEEVHAELLPAAKLALIHRMKKAGRRVAMVGDGINDAQALAEADLSIAMGAGHCDVAIETADVTLARNDLLLVADVLEISQKTLKTIYQNFVASVGINAGGLVFSAVGRLSPFSAAIVHNASTIAVVLNSLRLGREVAGSNPLDTLKEVKI
jgi:cation-transporting P-type ATPase C